ncbi:hypothetical protein H7673_11445, partial [Streptococcus dysgalactiae subsp. equisimilis]
MLTDAPGVAAYVDDIIVTGSNPEELMQRHSNVLDRIQEYSFRLHPEKSLSFVQSIKYLGFIIDRTGRRPDPENIKAITQMPPPKDVPTLRFFLKLVIHYGTFLPEIPKLREPL